MSQANTKVMMAMLVENLEAALVKEADGYKELLMKRILKSLRAADLLSSEGYNEDTIVILRVAMEHMMRLAYYHKNPEMVKDYKDAFKAFGKGPAPAEVIKNFDPGLYPIYSLLSSFVHPDMVSLVSDEGSVQMTAHLYVEMISMIILLVFKEVSSEWEDQINSEAMLFGITSVMTSLFASLEQLDIELDKEEFEKTDLTQLMAKNNFRKEFLKVQEAVIGGSSVKDVFKGMMLEELAKVAPSKNEE